MVLKYLGPRFILTFLRLPLPFRRGHELNAVYFKVYGKRALPNVVILSFDEWLEHSLK